MKKIFPQLCLLAAILISSACNRTPSKKSPAEQLESLDEAYKAGVFTKDEYDAKRAAIAPAAQAQTPAPIPQPAPAAAVATPAPAPAPVPAPVASAAPPLSAAPPPTPRPAPAPAVTPAPVPRPAPAPPAKSIAKAEPPSDSDPSPSDGCEDAEYKARKDGPQSRFFPQPMEKVHKAVLGALKDLNFTVHKDDTTGIEASRKRGIGVIVGAGGQREILQFANTTQNGRAGTLVTGRTSKKGQKSWTAAVLAQTACNLR